MKNMKIVAIGCKQNTPLPGSISGGNLVYRATDTTLLEHHDDGVLISLSKDPLKKKFVPFEALTWVELEEMVQPKVNVAPTKLNLKS